MDTAGIAIAGLVSMDTSKLKAFHISEAPEELYKQVMNANECLLATKYSKMPDTYNNKAYKGYAKVIVDGKVAAEIDNIGGVKTSNATGVLLSSKLSGSVNGKSGPDLAERRAKEIARILGGEVVKSSTAISQKEFETIPALKAEVDYEAMKKDEIYIQMQKTKEARALFLAQQIGQEQIYPDYNFGNA